MLSIDSERYLGNSDENTMHTRKPQWVAPLTALLITWLCLGAISAAVYHNRNQPSTKSFRLI